ncbi:MAG TPA: pseudouridine synthase [Saprospiraceae bacterium]|nr:pseudouridine synthase [Saprospiraceae bacterium]HPN71235.1 pseudouridine synthase [Saprospiraceae bacterium]
MIFEILYQDEQLIAINKPCGFFVHRTKLDNQASTLVLPNLRDQIGQRVYPVHRLDRKTSGVLLFALDQITQSQMNKKFAENEVSKTYQAIVRGHTAPDFEIDYAIINDKNKLQEALTYGKTMAHAEIPYCSWKHPSSRYSLVELYPQTGRQHQLRKHLSHIFHPIIGDRPHGCNKQNKFFLETFELNEMMLHATKLQFIHPNTTTEIIINAPALGEFSRIADILGFQVNN